MASNLKKYSLKSFFLSIDNNTKYSSFTLILFSILLFNKSIFSTSKNQHLRQNYQATFLLMSEKSAT
jgi:hypothetical protein